MLALFPQTQAVPVTWSKEGVNYMGTLKIMDKPAYVVIDSTGKVVRIERRLHVSYLPKKVVEQLNRDYPGNEILDVYELTDAADKKSYRTTYRFQKTSTFTSDGIIMK